ncbi:MAG TPA: DinB family protein [Thermoanaerobaculia bacterium]|jgi:uncharacterized damage-inducible protein DinB|nr:DinB family protein [Thermoanaerobaculia bacterium]
MSLSQSLLPEFDQEMASTRRLLERVPTDKFEWTPHDKSSPLGRLANHVANLPNMASFSLSTSELDIAGPRPPQPKAETTEELLENFDRAAAGARASIAAASDEDLFQKFSLRAGEKVIFSLPKIATLRAFFLSHVIHHRGQLTVYLRLNDIPVPGLYGPSADEM